MTTATDTPAVRAAFLADIIEHPECDDRRLIFADWLEDHGEEERAEFIRCAVAAPDAHTATNLGWQMETRLVRLQAAWREFIKMKPTKAEAFGLPMPFSVWLAPTPKDRPLPDGEGEAIAIRGFVHTVRLPTATFLQHRVELVRSHPIQRVELTNKRPAPVQRETRFEFDVYEEEAHANASYELTVNLVGACGAPTWFSFSDEEKARDWLSDQLLKRAKELAKEAARDQ